MKGIFLKFNCFLAENATVVGDVVMGDECSVWFNAVVRGDVHYIRMGVQDGACIHCTYQKYATNIGNNVSKGILRTSTKFQKPRPALQSPFKFGA